MSDKVQSLDSIAPIEGSKTGIPSDPVQAEYEEGKRYLENKEYGQAAVALHNSLVGFEEKKDENGIANATNQLGHVCLARKEYENALSHYQTALKICDESYDRMSVLAVLHKILEVHKLSGNHENASQVCFDILDHYHDNRDPQGTVATMEELAEIYLAAGKKEKAADSYRTISSIHKNFKHDNLAAHYIEKADKLKS